MDEWPIGAEFTLQFATMPEPERRRKRAAVSCVLCRRRKIRCNRELPCSNCLRARNGVCVYEPFPAKSSSKSPMPTDIPKLAGEAPTSQDGNIAIGATGQDPPLLPVTTPTAVSNIPLFSPVKETAPPTRSGYPILDPEQTARVDSSPVVALLSTPALNTGDEISALRSRIQQLEAQVSSLSTHSTEKSSASSVISGPRSGMPPGMTALSSISPQSSVTTANGSNTQIETATSSFGGTFHIHHEGHWPGSSEPVTCNVSHKTRLFGQSHWLNTVISTMMDTMVLMEPFLRDPQSRGSVFIRKCKHLSRLVKTARQPSWPLPLSNELPPRDLCDHLVGLYLKTIEPVYRIVHIPSLMKSYEKIWDGTPRDAGFLVQVKLILALGSISYDDVFSMRLQATRWLYEAMTWLSDPDFKSRLHLELVQSKILLLFAREMIGIGGHMVWNAVGDLHRLAMMMGLHRDPIYLPRMSPLATELRRRLWNTILELMLGTALASGGPPLISVDDYDTQPPGNFNDDDLLNDDPIPHPDNEITDSSVSIAMRKSVNIRLAIIRFLNDLGGNHRTYQEALNLDSQFRLCYKDVRMQLHGNPNNRESHASRRPSSFSQRWVDIQLHRTLLSLHSRFSGPESSPAIHAYSKRVVLEAALTIWNSARHEFSRTHRYNWYVPPPEPHNEEPDYLDRIMSVGSGIMRTCLTQAACLVALELRLQLREQDSMGLNSVRLDLLDVMADAKKWSLRCMETGEKNVKGYIGMSLMERQIRAMLDRVPREEQAPILVKQLEEDEELCLGILEGHLNAINPGGPLVGGVDFSQMGTFGGAGDMSGGGLKSNSTATSPHIISPNTGFDSVNIADTQMPDWQSMSMDMFLGLDQLDKVSWMFEDVSGQDLLM